MFQTAKNKTSLPSFWTGALLLLAAVWIVLLYAGVGQNLLVAWSKEEYSHGYLIPLVFAVWALRLLQQAPVASSPSAGAVFLLFAGIVLKFTGEVIANNWLSQISAVVSLVGLLGVFWGWAALKRIAAPLFFLLFAIPLPATVLPSLTAGMQLASSDLGVLGLQILGFSVFQEGNIIDLGVHKLQVAEACSGLRYLFPLMSLGYLVAFHAYKSAWRRAVLFLSTLPIAVLVNGLRIALMGMAVNWIGPKSIEGDLHEFEGFVVFAFCLGGLVLVKWGLDRLGKKEPSGEPEDFLPSAKFPEGLWPLKMPLRTAALFLLAVIVSTSLALALAHPSRQPALTRQSFATFPLSLGEWTGKTEALSADELKSLRLTDYLLTNYTKERLGLPVAFYIAYYESQSQGSSIHSPQICLPGAGWEIETRVRKLIDLGLPSIRPFFVNKEIIIKGDRKQLVYYWYRESGTDVVSNLEAKLHMIKSAFKSNRTDGSLIRLTTPVFGEQDEQKAEAFLAEFMKDALPLLPSYIPGE